jgi:N-acetylmuramoyl-L-alanine amidase
MRVVISSGHGKYVSGASSIIDEVEEARKVVQATANALADKDIDVVIFNDDTSTTQSENLETIVDFHNSENRDLDVSIHFNAYVPTEGPRGTECLYLTQEELADRVSLLISQEGGLTNRGAHERTDLYFLNHTDKPAILVEVCFVDSAIDVELYQENFDAICLGIAQAIWDHLSPVA